MEKTKNMKLWDSVCTTDPKHTKHVNVRGGFTAIDAQYQIMMATKQFGAAGIGWGWSFSQPVFPANDTIVIQVTLWHGNKENTVTQFGQKKLSNDEDAFKKAATDGLTKCLSYLGFNADVFMGKFDDNKYVNDIKKEFAKKNEEKNTPQQPIEQRYEKQKLAEAEANKMCAELDKLYSPSAIGDYTIKNAKMLAALEERYPELHKKVMDKIETKNNEIGDK